MDPGQQGSDLSEYMPDNGTIFKSLQQVVEWRVNERNKSCRNQDPQGDEELPRTDGEKAAIVRTLFKAFKSTINGKSSDLVRHRLMAVTASSYLQSCNA